MKTDAAHFTTGGLEGLPDLSDPEHRAVWLMDVNRHFFSLFVANPALGRGTGEIAALATVQYEPAVRELADQYATSGRVAALWKELKSVRRRFMELYESMSPLLMVRRYWRAEHQDVNLYSLSNKHFEDLKGFYIDCVETTFRLLVVAVEFARIKDTGETIIETQRSTKDIWWFEQIANGQKLIHLKNFGDLKPITDLLDLPLRNGVGHHAAHYEVGPDEIVYVKADDAQLAELRVPYTEFVDRAFGAYCAFELATIFFQFLFVAGRGKL